MKKILFILLALPMLWGCKEEKDDFQDWQAQGKALVEAMINAHGDYDEEAVAELLCGKIWQMDSSLYYDFSFQEITGVTCLSGSNPSGGYVQCYCLLFTEDGRYRRGIREDVESWERQPLFSPVEYNDMGSWSFDPAQRTIRLEREHSASNGRHEITLEALSEESFMWREVTTSCQRVIFKKLQ